MLLASTQTTRVRPFGVRAAKLRSRYYQKINGNITSSVDRKDEVKVGGSQYTESEGHNFLASKEKGVSDLGGEFFTTKRYVRFGPSGNYKKTVTIVPGVIYEDYLYDGICCATDPRGTGGSVPSPYSNDAEMDALGTTAISRTAPTNPIGSLLSALMELKKEGLPHLPAAQTNWADRTQTLRNAGNDYLNHQFGYVPLANEVAGFTSVVTDAPAVIEQYRRGIGRPIRREYQFPTVSTSTEAKLGSGQDLPFMLDPSYWYSYGTLYRSQSVLRKRWFSGCFTYYFPAEILGSRNLSDLALLADQLGLRPSPEVLWQVAPWSWAIDWFTNVGDVISNWTNFHEKGLVMRFGYMMEHSIITTTYSLVGCKPHHAGAPPISDVSFIIETKTRRKANPYGFGVSWDGLTVFQGSILAALGITRSR
jgi:hypothetical protein